MFPLYGVDLVAVAAVAVLQMILGFFWYSPGVFGKKWMQLTGMTSKPSAAEMKTSMRTGFLASCLSAYFLAMVVVMANVATLGEATAWTFVIWAATFLSGELHGMAWEKKPFELLMINATNAFLTVWIAMGVLVWWPF